ncbi:binding-protein-dependent transporters inner membrane component [Bifidobacterium dentium]|nr:hypothetical protein BIFDEN_00913 [Bifidobacterium dentium ATCC 27678]VEG24701.1 binding-protein-dependent transporters inner membrane component [Bifidobacterium dentium]
MVDVDWQLQRLVQGGSPCTVSSYYSYNQFFQVQQVGYGAAISTALTAVIIVFSIVFTIVQKRVEKELV